MGDWVPSGYLAWTEVVERAGQALFAKEPTPDGPRPKDVIRWLRDLLAEENAKLVAVVQHSNGDLEKLSVEFWRSDLAPSVLRTGTLKEPGPPGLQNDRPVLMRQSDLEKLLPHFLVGESDLEKPLPHRTTVAHERLCTEWLQDEVRKGSKQKSPKEYFKEAKEQGFDISERQFLRIWHAVVPSEWKRPGRPVKRPANRRTKSPH